MADCTIRELEARVNKLEIESGSFGVSLEKDIAALEKQMILQFAAADKAVNAALAAQKELVNTSFAASEKAITKAETAQTDYNVRSNEFRAALDDSNKLNMQRTEVMVLFKAFEDKMDANRKNTEKSLDGLAGDIRSLRESRAGLSGGWAWIVGAVGFIATIAALWSVTRGGRP